MIAALWARFSSWVFGAGALLVALVGIYLKGRAAGKQVEQQKATERELVTEREKSQTIQEAHDAQNNVAALPADAVRKQLQDKWTRDS